jgi:hypothetical protein
MTHNSIATPTTTKKVNTHTEYSQGPEELSQAFTSLSRADMALSRAEMEVSKAETSVGRLGAFWSRWAKITIILFLVPIIYGAWIIIVALREDYVFLAMQEKVLKSEEE